MNTVRKIAVIFTMVWMLPALSCAAQETAFIRIDRDDPDAWRNELENVRFLEDENMSGSAQFSETQFHELAKDLKERSDDVWVIDCRQESHGFINGIAVSWCGAENAANRGKTAEEIEAAEEELSGLMGSNVTAFTTKDDQPLDSCEYSVKKWQTERGLAMDEGMNYMRLACPDHCWPPAGVIDEFMAFAKDLDDDAWLHFHCQAGSGRTGAFMTIWEMMQKTDAPVEEILRHQAETGSGNLLDRAAPEKSPSQKERCVLARAMSLYIKENHESGYANKWSDWLEAHSRQVSMRPGETLGGEGFSSDPAVVSDTLRAEAAGQAAVLAGDIVYFVTVQ